MLSLGHLKFHANVRFANNIIVFFAKHRTPRRNRVSIRLATTQIRRFARARSLQVREKKRRKRGTFEIWRKQCPRRRHDNGRIATSSRISADDHEIISRYRARDYASPNVFLRSRDIAVVYLSAIDSSMTRNNGGWYTANQRVCKTRAHTCPREDSVRYVN